MCARPHQALGITTNNTDLTEFKRNTATAAAPGAGRLDVFYGGFLDEVKPMVSKYFHIYIHLLFFFSGT